MGKSMNLVATERNFVCNFKHKGADRRHLNNIFSQLQFMEMTNLEVYYNRDGVV